MEQPSWLLSKGRKEAFVDYELVLEEYGGDNTRARKNYKQMLYLELSIGSEVKDKIIGQSIIGNDTFIQWVRAEYLDKEKSRELPAIKEISSYRSAEGIFRAIEKTTGKKLEDLNKERGIYRQIAMDMLYRLGGLTGEEIGRLFGVGYTSVSQERKRLREKISKNRKLQRLAAEIERACEQ